MKKFSIVRIFTYNWPVKLVCLLIAISFWTYVSSTGVKVDNFPGGAALELRNTPEGMVAITDVSEVDIRIVAEKGVWSKLSSDSVKAYVDLVGLPAGTHEMGIKIQINVGGVQVADYSPQKALIRLEPKVAKNIPVNVKIEGSAAEGLVSGIPIVELEEVEISGAKSVIDKILEANAIIRLDGETDEVKKTVKLVALNAENENITGVTFKPQEVNITIPIVKAEATKTVGLKVATTGDVASDYWISDIKVTPPTITITGNSAILKSLNYLETSKINIDNLNKDLSTNIELNIPAGVTLIDQVNSIAVKLSVSKIESTKKVNAQISAKNIPSGLNIKSIDPQNVSVNIQAEADILKDISPEDIRLVFDLSGYTVAGSYQIDIQDDIFEVKDGVNILNFTPSSIRVELENK